MIPDSVCKNFVPPNSYISNFQHFSLVVRGKRGGAKIIRLDRQIKRWKEKEEENRERERERERDRGRERERERMRERERKRERERER